MAHGPRHILNLYSACIVVVVLSTTVIDAQSAGDLSEKHLNEGYRSRPAPATCGGRVNDTKGYIQTPNFPGAFPVPISCTWVFYAPPGQRVVLYFTQHYVRHSFYLAEYDLYHDDDFYVGKYDLGEVVFEREITSVVAYKPYLVLKFAVNDMDNLHIRVDKFLLDVHGFNITYEVIGEHEPTRPDACSVFSCSFLGDCLASDDFSSYDCHCYFGFFGDECQYGPYCDPERGENGCFNGGTCRYYMGSNVNTCDCPPNYDGIQCQTQIDVIHPECESLGCHQNCVTHANTSTCTCNEGYRLATDNKTCLESCLWRYLVRMHVLSLDNGSGNVSLCSNFTEQLLTEVYTKEKSAVGDITNISLLYISQEQNGVTQVEFAFTGEGSARDEIWLTLTAILNEQTRYCGTHRLDSSYVDFLPHPVLQAADLSNQDGRPAVEGGLLTLVCSAKGAANAVFTWTKDGAILDTTRSTRFMWVTRVVGRDGQTQIAELNIEKVQRLDEGDYTCHVHDDFDQAVRSIHVHVIPTPHMEVTPMAATVTYSSPLVITCLSRDDEFDEFTYQWHRDDKPLVGAVGGNAETVEELLPAGSRLNIRRVQVPAIYTCVIESVSGRVSDSTTVSVLPADNSVGHICRSDHEGGVSWQDTLASHVDYQRCPRHVKEWLELHPCVERTCKHAVWKTGRASRRCTCHADQLPCTWELPNFANCTSIALDVLSDKFQRLSLGYQVTSVNEVLQDLTRFDEFVEGGHEPFLAGDLVLVFRLIHDLQNYVNLYERDGNHHVYLEKSLRLAEYTMQKTSLLSAEEHCELLLEMRLLQYVGQLLKDRYFTQHHSNFSILSHVTIESVKLWQAAKEPTVTQLGGPVIEYATDGQMTGNRSIRLMLASYNRSIVANTMMQFLPQEYVIETDLVYADVQDETSYKPWMKPLPFVIHFTQSSFDYLMNRSRLVYCASWLFDDDVTGHWEPDACTLGSDQEGRVSCTCKWSGYYAVITQPHHQSDEVYERSDHSLVILVGAIISLVSFIFAVITRACFWGQLKGDSKAISINFSFVMIAINCILIGSSNCTDVQVMCDAVKMLLFALLLSAASFMLAEAIRLNEDSSWRLSSENCFKDAVVGYGLPLLPTLCTVVIGQFIGYSHTPMAPYCWICAGHWELFAFGVALSLIFLAFTVLSFMTLKNILWTNMYRYREERNTLLFYACRSVLTMVLILVLVGTSFPMACRNDNVMMEYIFSTALIALSFGHVFLCKSKSVLNIFSKCNNTSRELCTLVHGGPSGVDNFTDKISRQNSSNNSNTSINMTLLDPRSDVSKMTANDKASYKAFLLPTLLKEPVSQCADLMEEDTELTSLTSSRTHVEFPHPGEISTITSVSDSSHQGASSHTLSNSCACPNCIDSYPFKPSKGRSFILDLTTEKPVDSARKIFSYTCRINEESEPSSRRKCMPNPFPELKSPKRRASQPTPRKMAEDNLSDRSRSPNGSLLTGRPVFHLGGSDIDIKTDNSSITRLCSDDSSVEMSGSDSHES